MEVTTADNTAVTQLSGTAMQQQFDEILAQINATFARIDARQVEIDRLKESTRRTSEETRAVLRRIEAMK